MAELRSRYPLLMSKVIIAVLSCFMLLMHGGGFLFNISLENEV